VSLMDVDEEIRRTARLVEMNRDQLLQLEEQLQKVLGVQNEHNDVITSLKDLSNGLSHHYMTPLGAGVSIKHQPSDEPPVVVDIGSNIHIESSPDFAADLLEARVSELNSLVDRIEAEKIAINTSIQSYAQRFELLVSQKNSPKQTNDVSIDSTDSEEEPPLGDNPRNISRRSSLTSGLTLDD